MMLRCGICDFIAVIRIYELVAKIGKYITFV